MLTGLLIIIVCKFNKIISKYIFVKFITSQFINHISEIIIQAVSYDSNNCKHFTIIFFYSSVLC